MTRARPQGAAPRAAVGAALPPLPGGVVGGTAPPLRLPATHFAVALGFLLIGATGLVRVAPDIARGAFPLPEVVAVTHLFTLGWITTTIMGALYQFLPIALLVPIRSERLAHLGLALHAPGLLAFVTGVATGTHAPLLLGAALFATGLLLFACNLAATLRRAPARNLTWWALVGADVSLVSTIALGGSLAANLEWNHLGANRFLALGVHLHVAIAGWVMLVIVGVAQRLLPMFLLSHGASERPGRWAAGMLAGGVALLLALHHALTTQVVAAIAALLAGGTVAFILQAALFFRHRRKPALDAGLRLAGFAVALLGCGVVMAPVFVAHGLAAPRVATAYVLTLLSALSLFVAGHYYKILPFLIWFHRFGPLVGRTPVPRVAELYDGRVGNWAAGLLAGGAAGLIAATLTGAAGFVRIPAVLFLAGAAVLAVQMFTISRRRPA